MNFPYWNNNHPLVVLIGSLNISSIAFKVLPKYEGMGIILYEHYKCVSHLALSFNIINKSMMTQLLSHSFEEKAAEWFRTLAPQFYYYMERVMSSFY